MTINEGADPCCSVDMKNLKHPDNFTSDKHWQISHAKTYIGSPWWRMRTDCELIAPEVGRWQD